MPPFLAMAGRQVLSKLKYFKEQAFINGTWCASSSKQTFPVYSPSTREVRTVSLLFSEKLILCKCI